MTGPGPPMSELEERVEALERTVSETDAGFGDIRAVAEQSEDITALQAEVESLQDRVCELEAAVQAVRGYVGNVRAVNDEVEQRADAALAKAEALEEALDSAERPTASERGEKNPCGTQSAGTVNHASSGSENQPSREATGTGDPTTGTPCPNCGRATNNRENRTVDPRSEGDIGAATDRQGDAASSEITAGLGNEPTVSGLSTGGDPIFQEPEIQNEPDGGTGECETASPIERIRQML